MPKRRKSGRVKIRPCDQYWLKEKCIWERLFPDVYESVTAGIVECLPELKHPSMHAVLQEKASYYTRYFVELTCEDPLLKIHRWGYEDEEEIQTAVSFLDPAPDSEFTKESFYEVQCWENDNFIRKEIKKEILIAIAVRRPARLILPRLPPSVK